MADVETMHTEQDQRILQNSVRITRNEKHIIENRKGIAMSFASQSALNAFTGAEGAGVGNFQGENAIAVGGRIRVRNSFNPVGTFSQTGRGNNTAGIGIGWNF